VSGAPVCSGRRYPLCRRGTLHGWIMASPSPTNHGLDCGRAFAVRNWLLRPLVVEADGRPVLGAATGRSRVSPGTASDTDNARDKACGASGPESTEYPAMAPVFKAVAHSMQPCVSAHLDEDARSISTCLGQWCCSSPSAGRNTCCGVLCLDPGGWTPCQSHRVKGGASNPPNRFTSTSSIKLSASNIILPKSSVPKPGTTR